MWITSQHKGKTGVCKRGLGHNEYRVLNDIFSGIRPFVCWIVETVLPICSLR